MFFLLLITYETAKKTHHIHADRHTQYKKENKSPKHYGKITNHGTQLKKSHLNAMLDATGQRQECLRNTILGYNRQNISTA